MSEYYAKSDVGLKRSINQDSYRTRENRDGDFLGIVCDGIGGANAGEVASGEAVKYFADIFEKSGPFSTIEEAAGYLKENLDAANKRIYTLAHKNSFLKGMGTTVTGILMTKNGCLSFNAGDSRVYGILDGKLFRLTYDHTLVNQMLEKGEITYEESIDHPMKHYLVRALGITDKTDFDIHAVKDMDHYLLCSDGLCGYVSDDEMIEILNDPGNDSCQKKCDELLKAALLKGGYDNITVVVVRKL